MSLSIIINTTKDDYNILKMRSLRIHNKRIKKIKPKNKTLICCGNGCQNCVLLKDDYFNTIEKKINKERVKD